ncbi:MAG: PEP-CTERM sorting domain-containing protein [Candidatus Accumulibacter phosphatis]|nr:PEP-CTERM sorting domain-containing protein [Candidatus Accumulibacter phosphatis]
MFRRFQVLLGHMAVFVFGLLPVSQAIAADWMINEDYYQTDTRAATDFEFLLAGDVAARITGGGQTSITNAFTDPTRSTSLQPGFNNTIVRFAGSNAIPNSPTTKRHFGIYGTGSKPTVLTKAWSFPTAPFRVPVPKSNFDFAYDPLNDALRITLENTSPYTVTFQNVGYTISSIEYPIDQLTASGLPLSVFQPLTGFDHEYRPGEFSSMLIAHVPLESFAVTHATVFFSGDSSGMDYQATGDEWAQVRVAAAVPEPGALFLVLIGLACVVGFSRRRFNGLLVRNNSGKAAGAWLLLGVGMLQTGSAAADVFVVPLAAPPTAGDTRPFIDLKAKDTAGNDITIKTLIDGGSTSSELKVTAAVGTQLGVSGGTPGAERGINGVTPTTTGASIPAGAGVGFSSAPVTPGGQAASSPPPARHGQRGNSPARAASHPG